MDPTKLIKTYLKIRDAKAALVAEFTEKEKKLDADMAVIKAALLDYCKEQNVDSVRTTAGLVYRTVKTRYWTSDWQSMYNFVLENKVPEFFEKRLNQSVVKSYLEDNPDKMPPGLNVDSEYTVVVRRT
jgi:Zn/Cd-binding protein ZinT